MSDIVATSQRSEDLISKINVLSPADIADTVFFGLVKIQQYISKNEREGRTEVIRQGTYTSALRMRLHDSQRAHLQT